MQEMVRKAYLRDGKSKRQISRELGIHRDTVSRLLSNSPPSYQLTRSKASPVTGTYLEVIAAWLKADEAAPRKQQHTAKRIHERLREEYGFTGSERRIREIVAELRHKPKEVFLPLGFEPGEMAQVDWAEVTVNLAGVRTKVQLFCLVLNYSGALYCFEHYRKALERKPGALKHLRAVDKESLPEKAPKAVQSRYPQVYVRPPDLSVYHQLLSK